MKNSYFENILHMVNYLKINTIYFDGFEGTLFISLYKNKYPIQNAKEFFYSSVNFNFLNVHCYDVSYHNGDWQSEQQYSLEIPLKEIESSILKSINNRLFSRCKEKMKEDMINDMILNNLCKEQIFQL